MKLLAIDTSTERASVALTNGFEIFSDECHTLQKHAQVLLPMIHGLMTRAGIKLAELDGIVFGCGPGSFTGLRVACSIAKGLAYAHDLPLYPVSSLASMAEVIYDANHDIAPESRVLAMLDARMHEVYWGCFARGDTNVREYVTTLANVIMLTAAPLIITNSASDPLVMQLSPLIHKSIIMHSVASPDASAMIRLVKRGAITAVTAAMARPVYVRELQFKKVDGGVCG